MSDEEPDLELLALLRQSLGVRDAQDELSSNTGVLRDAEYIYNNAIDVSISMYGTKAAAARLYDSMQAKAYSTDAWSLHELHPKASEGFSENDMINFIFTMDLLNFSFWSELDETKRFQVEYRNKRWTGYNSLVACLRRSLDDGIPITSPQFWGDERCSIELIEHVFRSATAESIPLLQDRVSMLRETSYELARSFGSRDDPDNEYSELAAARGAVSSADGPQSGNDTHVTADGFSIVEDSATGSGASAVRTNTTTTEEIGSSATVSTSRMSQAENRCSDGSAAGDKAYVSRELSISDEFSAESASQQPQASITSADAPEQNSRTDSTAPSEAPALSNPAQSIGGALDVAVGAKVAYNVRPDHTVVRLIEKAGGSAGKLVNLLAKHFPSFRDEARFEGRKVRFLKRAQIFVADVWAAFAGEGLGAFQDIDELTMFADYRVPQMLHSLGVLSYSPPLDYHLRDRKAIDSGHAWEVQLRIWAVELTRREILKTHPEACVNAVLLDFFLYDLAKEREAAGVDAIPHHRVRSVCY